MSEQWGNCGASPAPSPSDLAQTEADWEEPYGPPVLHVDSENSTAANESLRVGSAIIAVDDGMVKQLSHEKAMTVPEMTTFTNPKLLRASLLKDVLTQRGALFSNSTGSAATYGLSSQVDRIDTFLSHNWSTPRVSKFLVLAVHFNWAPALAVSMTVLVVCSVLTAAGVAPIVQTSIGDCGVLGISLTAPLFAFVLTHWHEMPRCIWPGSKRVFVDKTCIHQTNEGLKRQGIEKLAAFLANSSRLLCCYNENYLMQMWTIYELATFLILHPLEMITLMPTYVPPSVLAGLCLSYVSSSSIFLLPKSLDLVPVLMTYFPLMTLIAYNALMRFCAHKRAAVRSGVEQFNIRRAKCSCEQDRPYLVGNVVDLLRHFSFVDGTADENACLDEFDRMVHMAVPQAVIKSLGSYGLPYRYQVCCCVLLALPLTFELTAAEVHKGHITVSELSLTIIQTTIHAVTTMPLALALGAKATGFRIDSSPRAQIAIVLASAMLSFAFALSVILHVDNMTLRKVAHEDQRWAWLIVFDCVLLATTILTYQGLRNTFWALVCCCGLRRSRGRDLQGSSVTTGYLVPGEEVLASEDCLGPAISGCAGPDTVTVN